MDSIGITWSERKLAPILDRFTPAELKYFDVDANIRTVTTFEFDALESKNPALYVRLRKCMAAILKMQTKLPMVALQPDIADCKYVSQKTPTSGADVDVEKASIVIEPINPGFFEFIKYIPINQKIPLETIYVIDLSVPFTANRRYAFKSNCIKPLIDVAEAIKSSMKSTPTAIQTKDMNKHIHIGVLDIGSHLVGKFVVRNVDLSIYDSYSLFRAAIRQNSIVFWVYDHINVDMKELLEMISNNVQCLQDSKAVGEETISDVKILIKHMIASIK